MMLSDYDSYLRHRKLKPGGFWGFHEYESFEEYKHRLGMPLKRRFPGFSSRFRKRRRLGSSSLIFRGRRRVRKVIGRRRHKTFPRQYFMGSRRWTPRKLAKCIESKMLEIFFTNNITLTNGLVTTTREYAICPNQLIVQGTTNAGFSGTCIWMRGIRLDFFLAGDVTHNDNLFVQVDVFRTKRNVDYSASQWTQLTNTGTEAEADQAFYDRTYGATSTISDAQNFLAVANHRGGGPKLLARHSWKISMPSAATQSYAQKCKIWFPMNQLCRFRHDNFSETSLDTAPNFFDNGDILFILKYYNALAASGTQSSLTVSGTTARLYFKDA